MSRKERGRIFVTVVAALAIGGAAGAGVSFGIWGPAVAVSIAVLAGLAAGSQVLRAALLARRRISLTARGRSGHPDQPGAE